MRDGAWPPVDCNVTSNDLCIDTGVNATPHHVTVGVRYYYRVRAAINTGYVYHYSAACNEADAVPY